MSNHHTFSSSLLNEIFLSIDGDSHPAPSPPPNSRNLGRLLAHDRKISSLRRSRLVDKWMEKPIIPPPPPRRQRPPPPPPPPVVPAATDEDPDSFFSTTSVSSSDSGLSSTPSDIETPSFDPSSKPKASCFGPFRAPKPVRTKPKSTNSDQFEEKSSSSSSASSRAVKIYAQLKSLKQPISPGMKLAKYINSLTSKKKKSKNADSEQFRAIPVKESSAIAGDSKVGRSASKSYEISGIDQVDVNRKVLEEVAFDLLNSYCNRRKTENGDGDDSSCSSSDLFEIDHLSLIGNEELPVYETTNLITS